MHIFILFYFYRQRHLVASRPASGSKCFFSHLFTKVTSPPSVPPFLPPCSSIQPSQLTFPSLPLPLPPSLPPSLPRSTTPLRLALDGPYGCLSILPSDYSHLLLVGGGIGVTPLTSTLRALYKQVSPPSLPLSLPPSLFPLAFNSDYVNGGREGHLVYISLFSLTYIVSSLLPSLTPSLPQYHTKRGLPLLQSVTLLWVVRDPTLF